MSLADDTKELKKMFEDSPIFKPATPEQAVHRKSNIPIPKVMAETERMSSAYWHLVGDIEDQMLALREKYNVEDICECPDRVDAMTRAVDNICIVTNQRRIDKWAHYKYQEPTDYLEADI